MTQKDKNERKIEDILRDARSWLSFYGVCPDRIQLREDGNIEIRLTVNNPALLDVHEKLLLMEQDGFIVCDQLFSAVLGRYGKEEFVGGFRMCPPKKISFWDRLKSLFFRKTVKFR